MIKTDMSSAFCTFEQWSPFLPTPFKDRSESEWQARSHADNWAKFIRIDGQRSTALYRKRDIIVFFRLKYGAVFPECVEALLASEAFKGFGEDQQKNYRNNKNKKGVRRERI